jgi:GT2 family glycosyltransferase
VVTRTHIPSEVLTAAHDRARARAERDWTEADRLRGLIEDAGWRIADRGTDFALTPANPPTLAAEGVVRYGASTDVPSRLDGPATAVATVVIVATEWPDDVARALAGIAAWPPAGTEVVVVADGPSPDQDAALDGATAGDLPIEVVRTSARLGQAAAVNIGLRRSGGSIIVVMDASVEPTGDVVTPLVLALDDPAIAVTGGWGVASDDLRRFHDSPAGEVDAIEGYLMAFRRSDGADRGPLDERFRFYRNLDLWWSLVLRDEGEGNAPRRALAVDVPAMRHEHRGWTSLPESERDRLSKRNFYRIIDRFGNRRDLASVAGD